MTTIEYKPEERFDAVRLRHYLNNDYTVMHCHHYLDLFAQLADDAKLFNGDKIMADTAEETFYGIFANYFTSHDIEFKQDRITIIEQYFSFVGLGLLKIVVNEDDTGSAEMSHSHVDEGWVKKWTFKESPINFLGWGLLAAAFSAINNNPTGTYKVTEINSIVSGNEMSKFIIEKY
jgi:predicted hydrocarbon binding protein